MLNVTVHGVPASYCLTDGWRCNDALVEKYLRAECEPDDKHKHESTALASAVRHFPAGAVVLQEPDAPDGEADAPPQDAAGTGEAQDDDDDDDASTPRRRAEDAALLDAAGPKPSLTTRLSDFFTRRNTMHPLTPITH